MDVESKETINAALQQSRVVLLEVVEKGSKEQQGIVGDIEDAIQGIVDHFFDRLEKMTFTVIMGQRK